MSNNTKTNTTSISIILVLTALLGFLFASCGKKESLLKEAAVSKEVSYSSGRLLAVTPAGIATVRIIHPYGLLDSSNCLWEDYREQDRNQWKTYGHSVYIQLRGEAKIGDTVQVIRKVSTFKLKTGEVYEECTAVFAQRTPAETAGK